MSQIAASAYDLNDDARAEAEDGAVKLGFAVAAGGRTRVEDLARLAGPEASQRYEKLYRPAIAQAQLVEVNCLRNFPY